MTTDKRIEIIDDDTALHGLQTFLNLFDQGASLPRTLREWAIYNDGEGTQVVETHIHMDLLPDFSSYRANPAQLAKITNVKSLYPYIHGFIRDPYIVIVFAKEPVPTSFWQQCLDYCRLEGTYEFAQSEVPVTYQHTPSLLRWRLKNATGKNVRVIKTKTLFKLVVPKLVLTGRKRA